MFKQEELREDDLPVFLKPEVGQGSKGTHLAEKMEDLEYYVGRESGLLILEYLPGKEYTIDCFTNNKGELIFCEARERIRVQNGISVRTETVNIDELKVMAEKINQSMEFRGVWFFQAKMDKNNKPTLLEVAPRMAGTMALVRSKGVNLALLSLFDAMGYEVSIDENDYNIEIDRALDNKYKHDIVYSHVYIDFDDLVIFEGEVNPSVMAFVFQCINKKIKLHLITKHKYELTESLKKYRLSEIFDELIWINEDDEKPSLIKEKDAIFIDDSFAERMKVHKVCGIPVFDLHMIEALMEN